MGGLLGTRRALTGPGHGLISLSGGYQMLGRTWQEAGARDVLEETEGALVPSTLRLLSVVTPPDTRQNRLFC